MKWYRMILAVTLLGAASCSSPTVPRLPQPEDDRPPGPDSPGIAGLGLVHPLAGQVQVV